MIINLIPVSYIHLDVYKRQSILSAGHTRKASAPTLMTLSPVRIGRSSRAATKRLLSLIHI